MLYLTYKYARRSDCPNIVAKQSAVFKKERERGGGKKKKKKDKIPKHIFQSDDTLHLISSLSKPFKAFVYSSLVYDDLAKRTLHFRDSSAERYLSANSFLDREVIVDRIVLSRNTLLPRIKVL